MTYLQAITAATFALFIIYGIWAAVSVYNLSHNGLIQ